MSSRTRKAAIWVATESSYGIDPSANGSGYLWVPTLSLGQLKDEKAPLVTDWFTGRNYPTTPTSGPDGWSLDCEVPLIGLLTAAGDGVDASTKTADWLDNLLSNIFGATSTTSGEGVAAAGASSITFDTDAYDVQDLIAVYEASLTTPPRTQWALITVDSGAGVYTIAPAWETQPTGAAVGYGARVYRPDDDGGSSSIALVYRQDATDYTLLGGHVTAAKITATAGQMARLALSLRGDSITQETKGSLPAAGTGPATTPIKMTGSPLYFGGSAYETDQLEIDLAPQAVLRNATAGANGRGGDENLSYAPTITARPLTAEAQRLLKRNCTTGRLLVQLGAGILTSSVLGTIGLHWESVVAEEVTITDENGRLRDAIKFRIADAVEFSAGVDAVAMQLARC